uniref:CRISPR-associated protein, Csd2 family n=1 Tax=Nitratidesulfovibrio vulgaris (strain DSM 19637 / Miyazaki F) TaxID=883 RepID=B8DQ53_NITV9
MSQPISKRYEFVLFFDVENGNPNGDPDAGNLPRLDPETSHGLVTDVCLKRKVRNYISIAKGNTEPHLIFIKEKSILNSTIRRPYEEDPATKACLQEWLAYKKNKKTPKPKEHYEDLAQKWLCQKHYDIRAFGAVMSTGEEEKNEDISSKIRMRAGQVRGPVQMAFARSVEPVVPLDISITRMAVATEREAEAQEGDNRTMGRKSIIPYGLYRAEGFVSAHLAAQTGFTDDDLELFWQALESMFEHDHSAARGKMASRALIVFEHEGALGNAPAHKLFELVASPRAEGSTGPARAFEDYAITVNDAGAPAGVRVIRRL